MQRQSVFLNVVSLPLIISNYWSLRRKQGDSR